MVGGGTIFPKGVGARKQEIDLGERERYKLREREREKGRETGVREVKAGENFMREETL